MTQELEMYIVEMLNSTFIEEFVEDVLKDGIATVEELKQAGFNVSEKYIDKT